jgi:ABC-type nickel/cobalt efflux system permease component RcnA
MKRKILAFAFMTAAALSLAAESPNPFTSAGPGPSAATAGPVSNFVAALAPFLRVMTDRLTELARTIRDERSAGPMLALASVSFLYGIFHALGPGHGKTVVSVYFLAKEGKLRHSLIAGYLVALVHAVSSVTIVTALYYIIKGVFSAGFEGASRIVQILSFGVIAVMGAVMLVRRIIGAEHKHEHGHFGHKHHEHEDEHEDKPDEEVTFRGLFGVAAAAGVVPCPGVSAILLVCASLGIYLMGVLAAVMISVGMGITVTVVGAITILAKSGALKLSGHGEGRASRVLRRVIEIAGAALLFLIGLLFLIAQF